MVLHELDLNGVQISLTETVRIEEDNTVGPTVFIITARGPGNKIHLDTTRDKDRAVKLYKAFVEGELNAQLEAKVKHL
jgi:hypothetical protein